MVGLIRRVILFGLICMVLSGFLSAFRPMAQSKIMAQTVEESSLAELLPGASRFEAIKSDKEVIYYKGYAKDNRFIGVVFRASGKGYSGAIETMAGMSADGKITLIKVISQNESAGVGSRITEPGFAAQFSGKEMGIPQGIQAIAGATISSSAVINSVSEKARGIMEILQEEGLAR